MSQRKRYFTSLNPAQQVLLADLMAESYFDETETSRFLASAIVEVDRCRRTHGKSKVGRPTGSTAQPSSDTEEEEDIGFTDTTPKLPDNLTLSPEDLKRIKKKS